MARWLDLIISHKHGDIEVHSSILRPERVDPSEWIVSRAYGLDRRNYGEWANEQYDALIDAHRERLRVRLRILDGDVHLQVAVGRPLAAVRELRLLGVWAAVDFEPAVVRAVLSSSQIVRFDHEVIALPVSDRVAVPKRLRFALRRELPAILEELRERRSDRTIETNVEFWAAVILDFAEVPPHMMPAMFTCARTGGWSAHILEQKRTGRLIRPSAVYVGPPARGADEVEGWREAWAD